VLELWTACQKSSIVVFVFLHLAGVWNCHNDDNARLCDGPVLRHLSPSPPSLRSAPAQGRRVPCSDVDHVSGRRICTSDRPGADCPGRRLCRVVASSQHSRSFKVIDNGDADAFSHSATLVQGHSRLQKTVTRLLHSDIQGHSRSRTL